MLKEDTLSHYMETHQIEWATDLPDNCPPEDILVPEDEEFYRLLLNEDEFVEEDFKSYKELYPERSFNIEDWINAHGLSVYRDIDRKILKLPRFKNKFKGLAKLTLNPSDGVVKKTYSDKKHFTWWKTKSFNLNSVEIIKDGQA